MYGKKIYAFICFCLTDGAARIFPQFSISPLPHSGFQVSHVETGIGRERVHMAGVPERIGESFFDCKNLDLVWDSNAGRLCDGRVLYLLRYAHRAMPRTWLFSNRILDADPLVYFAERVAPIKLFELALVEIYFFRFMFVALATSTRWVR